MVKVKHWGLARWWSAVSAVIGIVTPNGTSRAGEPTSQPAPMSIDYYVPSPAAGSIGEIEPYAYVRTLSETGLPGTADIHWLDFGIEHRTRYEYRDDDLRRPTLFRNTQFLHRSRAYLGLHDVVDPFRMVVEFQDSRAFGDKPFDPNRDIDENDILQLIGELYFRDALGLGRPLRFQAGRMTLQYVDRRLVSRNGWRNTLNQFEGFRVIFGQQSNDWQLDLFAVQPVENRTRQPDRVDEEEWFYGVVGQWRRWSKWITLQPYYLLRDRDNKGWNAYDVEIHTFALRGYGYVEDTGLDFDTNVAWQCGRNEGPNHRAFAVNTETGYTFQHEWQPRLSAVLFYASGDRNPYDDVDQRFDRLYGSSHFWSTNDYFILENVIGPKLRLQLKPLKNTTFETGYNAYWLANDSDSWSNANRQDPTGQSGDFIGQEVDVQLRWQVDPRVEIIVGYAHFMPGPFTDNTGPSDDSDFFYVETSLQLFK